MQLVNLNPEEVAVAVVEEPRGRAMLYCRLLGWGGRRKWRQRRQNLGRGDRVALLRVEVHPERGQGRRCTIIGIHPDTAEDTR